LQGAAAEVESIRDRAGGSARTPALLVVHRSTWCRGTRSCTVAVQK